MKSSSTIEKAKAAMRVKFTGPKDGKGYSPSLQDNLVLGVCLEQFKDDLLQGHGNELETKFRAVHSSSALAVNCCARFKVVTGTNAWLARNRSNFHVFVPIPPANVPSAQ